jgi:hypothetical protein
VHAESFQAIELVVGQKATGPCVVKRKGPTAVSFASRPKDSMSRNHQRSGPGDGVDVQVARERGRGVLVLELHANAL